MTEYASTESGNREKIKTQFAKIIVNNGAGDTYYHVMWWQDGEMQIGFGSRNLQFVRKWLSDEFEVDTPEADVAPVAHAKWILDRFPYLPARECSRCTIMIPRMKQVPEQFWQYCPNCGARMDGETE